MVVAGEQHDHLSIVAIESDEPTGVEVIPAIIRRRAGKGPQKGGGSSGSGVGRVVSGSGSVSGGGWEW